MALVRLRFGHGDPEIVGGLLSMCSNATNTEPNAALLD